MTQDLDMLVPNKVEVSKGKKQNSISIERNRAEEPALIKAWQDNGCANSLTTLIERYRPLIGSQISKILAGRSVGRDHRQDLEQEANLAFIGAVSAFSPEFRTHLSSFATNHIRNSLLRYALDYRHSYRIGTSSSERKAFYAALACRAGRIHHGKSENLSDKDIAGIQKSTGASEKTTKRAVASIYARSTNIDDELDLTDGTSSCSAEHAISVKHAMHTLEPFIAELPEREKTILQAHLAEGRVDAQHLGKAFKISPERVGQIRRGLFADMAIYLKSKGIKPDDLF